MTNRQAIEFASKHSFLELYEEGKKDGKAEAILNQANHDEAVKQAYQQGGADAIEEFIKEHTSLNFRGEPYIFITNTEYEQLKEQKNE